MAVKQMSRESYEKLVAELDDLKINKRKEVAERLKVARSYGDLSENAEYDEAKNEQAILEATIAEMQITLENAEIVEGDSISTDQVGVGSTIEIKREDRDKIEKFKIVGTSEANPLEGKISDDSPIGKAALKKKDAQPAATSVDNAITQIVESEELTDDLELVAVISAAIAAYEGSASTAQRSGQCSYCLPQ